MSDGFAFFIVIVGIVTLIAVTVRSLGKYEEQVPLSPGSYLVGFDIDPGKCDVVAATGGGSFIVKNRTAKAWEVGNMIGITSGFQSGRFRNLRLGRGDVMEVNGNVTVLLVPPLPIRDPSKEPLCAGVYRFGVDVPTGRYDLEVVGGDGDVLLVHVKKDSYNFYQDMCLQNPCKTENFKNVFCTSNYELWVNGNLQVKLKRSEKQLRFLQLLERLGFIEEF